MNNEEIGQNILNALKWRYATKIFDKNKKISTEDLNTILESGRLSPSALGLEAWKFFVVEDTKIREELFAVSKQPKVTDASHLIVITYRTDVIENITRERLERTAQIQGQKIEELDGLKNIIDTNIAKKATEGTLESWIRAQAYIPLGIMLYTASFLGIDNCPMEGFENEKVDEILGLKEKNLKSVTMLALGHRGEDPTSTRPKVRRDFSDVIEFI